MAVINADGLFAGDRLSMCSDRARLYWPYFFLASNGYGRLELNYRQIVHRAFQRFRKPPTEDEAFEYLNEYFQNFLLFIYRSPDGQLWGQWDTDEKYLPRHKTVRDSASPAPSADEFSVWLQKYYETKRRSSEDLGSFRKFSEVLQNFQKVSAGVGVGVGKGEAISSSPDGPDQTHLENEVIEALYRHYIFVTEKNPKTYRLTEPRRHKLRTRLEECLKATGGDRDKAAGLMRLAVDAIARSDWHMGRDQKTNGKRYNDLVDHIFGSYELMEKWWNA